MNEYPNTLPTAQYACPYTEFQLQRGDTTATLKVTGAYSLCSKKLDTEGKKVNYGGVGYTVACQWYTPNEVSNHNTYLVDLDVSFFGGPCKNPTDHAASTSSTW